MNKSSNDIALESLVSAIKKTISTLSDYSEEDVVVDIHVKTTEETMKDKIVKILTAAQEENSMKGNTKKYVPSKIESLQFAIDSSGTVIRSKYYFYYENKYYYIEEGYFNDYRVNEYKTGNRTYDESTRKSYMVSKVD